MRILGSGRIEGSFLSASRLCLYVVLLCVPAIALDPSRQISQYAHTAWRFADEGIIGPPLAFAQTRDGYLWIGTSSGLLRFDGVRFVPWSPPDGHSLPSDFISNLLGASDGSLWIGTERGLVRWKDGSLTNYSPVPALIGTLLEDPDGAIWLARAKIRDGKGPLCEVTGSELSCHGAAEGIPFRYAKELLRDSLGNIWISGPAGLCRWQSGSSETYSSSALQRLQEVLGINAMALAADGSLWVGMRRTGPGLGLQEFVNGKWKDFSVPGFDGTRFSINALFVDRDSSLWIGTPHSGIYRLHAGKVEQFTSADGLSSDTIERFYQDREGNLWVATSKGIDQFHDTPVTSFSTREGLTTDEATSVLGTRDGTVWIGNVGALDFFRHGKISAVKQNGIPKQLTTALFEDDAGQLWAGVDGGLDRDGPDHHFHAISQPNNQPLGMVTAMTEDVDHSLWAETAVGNLFRIKNSLVQQEFSRSQIPRANALAADPKQGIWLGLESGDLARYQRGHLETISLSHGVKPAPVWNILVDSDGSVWASTDAGLVHWKEGKRDTLSSHNGLPCDAVYDLVKDDQGSYWLDTRCGYIRIAAAELQRWSQEPDGKVKFRILDVFDGALAALSTFRPTASKSSDGRIWFSTDSKVQMINPARLGLNTLEPPVHVEQVVADRKSYFPKDGLHLPPRTRDLEIDYTALSFVAPQKVRFRYKLEGHDADWQDPQGRRQAFYTDLPPGDYQFRVIAANNDGVWNETGAMLAFAVLPAYYQTTWFRLLCFAMVAGILWLLYALRLRQVAGHMQARLEERLEERERIARDLHDTLLQGFLSAYMQLDVANDRLSADSPAKPLVQRVLDLMKQVSEEGRNAIRRLRSPHPGSNGLEEKLSGIRGEFPLEEQVDFRVVVEGKPIALHPLIREEVYRIAREAMTNAFRHSQASKIEVEIKYAARSLRILVRDNGCGVDPEVLQTGREGHWGLSNMRERAEKIGAKFAVLSRAGAGTEVELSVPGKVAFETASSEGWWKRLTRWFPGQTGADVPPSRE